jgi:hypothetical protein
MIKGIKSKFFLDLFKSFYSINVKIFTSTSDGKNLEVKDEFVIKQEEEKSNLESYEKEIMSSDNSYLTAPSKVYFDLIEHHRNARIPFSDDKLYVELFKFSSMVMNNTDLESWGIIEKYAMLNIERINIDFLVQIIEQLSKVRTTNFEFWYLSEKKILNNLNSISNYQLSSLIYHFAISDSGSNHLFNTLADEVLNRGIRKFKEHEFVLIFNGFKYNRIKDKVLWAFLNRAKLELHPNLEI